MNIIYGICGIGHGHTYRQAPLIDKLLKEGHKICLFAHAASLSFYKNKYSNHEQNMLKIVEVAVPFVPGNTQEKVGLDFNAASNMLGDINYTQINFKALSEAQDYLGPPDVCITDYEPISAQYAYAHDCPVITFDQQSKYLGINKYPPTINNVSVTDEVMRLNMFFPKAHKRVACSFFNITSDKEDLMIVPPTIRKMRTMNPALNEKLRGQKIPELNSPDFVSTQSNKNYLIYLSAQKGFKQDIHEILNILNSRPEHYHLFLSSEELLKVRQGPCDINLSLHAHGDEKFDEVLQHCNGVISTAGHTLLSECMAQGTPVYAMPMNIYEQQLNAHVIAENHFGLNEPNINPQALERFIQEENRYKENIIKNENNVLCVRGNATNMVLAEINKLKK